MDRESLHPPVDVSRPDVVRRDVRVPDGDVLEPGIGRDDHERTAILAVRSPKGPGDHAVPLDTDTLDDADLVNEALNGLIPESLPGTNVPRAPVSTLRFAALLVVGDGGKIGAGVAWNLAVSDGRRRSDGHVRPLARDGFVFRAIALDESTVRKQTAPDAIVIDAGLR